MLPPRAPSPAARGARDEHAERSGESEDAQREQAARDAADGDVVLHELLARELGHGRNLLLMRQQHDQTFRRVASLGQVADGLVEAGAGGEKRAEDHEQAPADEASRTSQEATLTPPA
jgi:hypothetical protein